MKINWKQTLAVRYFGFSKIPLIFFAAPQVYKLDEEECQIGIRLNWRTKNHLNSLYFGALAIGADLACGLLAMHLIQESPYRLSLVFKDVQAQFYKRVDAHAIFRCDQGEKIQKLIEKVHATGDRQHEPLTIQVTAPEKYGEEILAEFVLTLSLKEITA